MRPDIEFTLNLKKARLKENDAEIERLNDLIKSLENRRDKERNSTAKRKLEIEISAKIELRKSLVEQNRIDAQIVLALMK